MIGIENLSKATVALGKIGSSVGDALANGKIGLEDTPEGMEIVQVVPVLLSVDVAAAKAEAKDIDAEEKAKLAELFRANFNLVNDDLEATIEEGVEFLFAGVKFFSRFLKKAEAPVA